MAMGDTNTAVKDMASRLSSGNAPNNVRESSEKEHDRKYKIELGNLKSQFEQDSHYQPNYEVNYKRKSSITKSENKDMGDILRPEPAGTREVASYGTSFSKQNLSSLKSMFEQKKQETTVKSFVPDFTRPVTTIRKKQEASVTSEVVRNNAGEREKPEYVPSVSLSAAKSVFSKSKPDEYKPKTTWNRPVKKAPPVVKPDSSENSEETAAKASVIVRSDNKVDDRPTTLTTSLKSAKAMFEQGSNSQSPVKKVVPQATWEGKDGFNVLGNAKSKFEGTNKERKDSTSSESSVEEKKEPENTNSSVEEKIEETVASNIEVPTIQTETDEEKEPESVRNQEEVIVPRIETPEELEEEEIPVSEAPPTEVQPSDAEIQQSQAVSPTEMPSEAILSPTESVAEISQVEESDAGKEQIPISLEKSEKPKDRISSYESADVLSDASQSSSMDDVKNEGDFDV